MKKIIAILLLLTAVEEGFSASSGLETDNYDYLFMQAIIERQRFNNDTSFELLKRCVEINPQASEAYFFLAQCYLLKKNFEKNLECNKKAVELSPDNTQYLETLAQSYLNNSDIDNAIATYEQLSNVNSENMEVLGLLIDLYNAKNDYTSMLKTLDRLEMIDGKKEKISLAKSKIYSSMNNHKAAISEMKNLSDSYPNNMDYYCAYGERLMDNDETDKALKVYADVFKKDPENSIAQLAMRNYYIKENNNTAADSLTNLLLLNKRTKDEDKIFLLKAFIQENVDKGGDSTEVINYLDRLYAADNQSAVVAQFYVSYMMIKDVAREKLDTVLYYLLYKSPDDVSSRLLLINNAWNANEMDKVIELCESGRQYSPDNIEFYYYQGMAYFKKNENSEAIKSFQAGVRTVDETSDNTLVSELYAAIGDLLHVENRDEEAFAAYDSCLQWKEDNIGCLNNYAYYLSEKGINLDKAEQMSYKTIKAEPKNDTYLDTYAWILFMQGRYKEAAIYIDQAVLNDSTKSSELLEHSGDIHFMCGETDKAVELWKQASEKDANNKLLIRKIKNKKYIKE